MKALWEIRKEVLTPEEVIDRINKLIESWAEEESLGGTEQHPADPVTPGKAAEEKVM